MLTCPECGSSNLVKEGVVWSGRTKEQRHVCKDCGKRTIGSKLVEKEEENK